MIPENKTDKKVKYGYRRMTTILNRDYGILINRKRTRRYMREWVYMVFAPAPTSVSAYVVNTCILICKMV